MKYLVGSGTLVQVDARDRQPRYGVLTCGHVLGAFEKTMEGARNESLTLLVPNNGPGPESPAWSMRMRYHKEMAIIEGARNEDSIGPDLAWLPLTRDQAQMLEDGGRSRAVFYNLTTGLRNRGVLTPYAGLALGEAGDRTVRAGTRWQFGPDVVVGLEATRQTSEAGEGANEVRLRAALRF